MDTSANDVPTQKRVPRARPEGHVSHPGQAGPQAVLVPGQGAGWLTWASTPARPVRASALQLLMLKKVSPSLTLVKSHSPNPERTLHALHDSTLRQNVFHIEIKSSNFLRVSKLIFNVFSSQSAPRCPREPSLGHAGLCPSGSGAAGGPRQQLHLQSPPSKPKLGHFTTVSK